MAKIGLRYPPPSGTDPWQHAAQLALLTTDIAHLPVDFVERAGREWAANSPFMPKASDLIGLCTRYAAENDRGTDAALQRLQDHCNNLNRLNIGRQWFVAGEAPNRYVECRDLI